MIKRIALGTMAVAVVGSALFGRDAWSYACTGYSEAREAVRREVPIEFDLQRARHELTHLMPEIRRSMHVIAEEQVEVERLRASIDKKAANLASQEEAILTLSADLKTNDRTLVYAGHRYSVGEVERDLAERFNRFKVADETLRRQKEMLTVKEQALLTHRETLENMLSKRKDMEVELERLEARMHTVAARKQISELNIDDSQLSRLRGLFDDIDKRLDVEDAVLDAEGNFAGLIPVESDDAVTGDISEQIEAYFHSQGVDEEGNVAAVGH